jgi:osmotically-inducible protein OsmY
MRRIPIIAVIGAALMYFFDPTDGKRRRHALVDRTGGLFRGTGRKAGRAGGKVTSQAKGLTQKAKHIREERKPEPNDATLKAKVESEIFRDPEVPKGKIDVNAENGVVYLRGEADGPELIETLEKQVRKVEGVQGVEVLLHLPGEPAKTKSG